MEKKSRREYLEAYAKDRCNGDIEEALTHAMVREVLGYLTLDSMEGEADESVRVPRAD